MKYAVIADVHSNLEALERTIEEIKARTPDRIICLGDIVGYGANPSECLKLIQNAASEIVMGNHELAVIDERIRESFVDWAAEAIEWTAAVLKEDEQVSIRDFAPIVIDHERNVTLVHGSVYEPDQFHYIFDYPDAIKSFNVLKTNFCFFGHTHVPALFSQHSELAHYLPAGTYPLKKGERYLINPGSVGQPRDRNPKLSFAMFDSEELALEIVRLDYDNQKAAAKIRKAGLPDMLARRLL